MSGDANKFSIVKCAMSVKQYIFDIGAKMKLWNTDNCSRDTSELFLRIG